MDQVSVYKGFFNIHKYNITQEYPKFTYFTGDPKEPEYLSELCVKLSVLCVFISVNLNAKLAKRFANDTKRK